MSSQTQRTWPVDERPEQIRRPQESETTIVVPGVSLCSLIAAHCHSRNLFTALLTLNPKASYPLYTRPVIEALTLIEGDAAVEVEDRRYQLKTLDALCISPHIPRRVSNLSSNHPVVFLVSLAANVATQTWVNGRFTPIDQPPTATGRAGVEQISRHHPALSFEIAPSARFQDLFSADIGGQTICGGYGLFEPGARLPCHRHEFDESITIVHGTATCIVEGRRHELSANATVLVPQGRCHYFINLTLEPMTMIWVYAGASPVELW